MARQELPQARPHVDTPTTREKKESSAKAPNVLLSIVRLLSLSSGSGRHTLGGLHPHENYSAVDIEAMPADVVNDADTLLKVLQNSNVVRPQLQQRLPIGALVAKEGDLYLAERRSVKHLLSREAVGYYIPTIATGAQDAFESWPENQDFDPLSRMVKLFNKVVADTIFVGNEEMPDEYIKLASEILPKMVKYEQWKVTPVVGKIPLWGQWTYQKELANLYKVFAKYLQETQVDGKRNPSVVNHMVWGIQMELKAQGIDVDDPKPEKARVARERVIKETTEAVNGLWMTATETTSHATTFSLEYLSQYPEKWARLRAEALTVLGDKDPSKITMDDLDKLPYAKACFLEALRKTPVVDLVMREVLPDENGKGITINGKYYRPKSIVLLNINDIMQNPKIWGDDVGNYSPERLFGISEKSDLWKILMLMFADPSKHKCAGENLAIAEGTLLLSQMALQFSSAENRGEGPKAKYEGTTTPDKNKIRLQRASPQAA